eukprot:1177539-Prorocentrum_minimum.AAC.1
MSLEIRRIHQNPSMRGFRLKGVTKGLTGRSLPVPGSLPSPCLGLAPPSPLPGGCFLFRVPPAPPGVPRHCTGPPPAAEPAARSEPLDRSARNDPPPLPRFIPGSRGAGLVSIIVRRFPPNPRSGLHADRPPEGSPPPSRSAPL